MLRQLESEGERVDVSVLGARLKRLYAEPVSGAVVRGMAPVDLMTIHKAKGLEWDVVLVPGMERGGGRASGVLLNWLEFDEASGDAEAGVVLAPIWSKGTDKDRLSGWLSGIRRKREAAERKRVFYVAATRAKEEVHLFGAVERKASGELASPQHDSLLRACWPAAAMHFEQTEVERSSVAERLMESLRIEEEDEYSGLALAAGRG